MAQAYTPGLTVTPFISHRVRRLLPLAGDVLVKEGDKVESRDVVAQTFMPGDVTPINLANVLSLPPADVPECLLKKEGERIEIDEPLARTKGIFGMFKNEYKSKVAGTLESISSATGQVILRGEPHPVQVRAYLSGVVKNIIPNEGVEIESDVTFIQGIFGIGGECYGEIKMACSTHTEELREDSITPQMKDKIVVGGARMTGAAIHKAIEVGVAAIVSGGMDDQDLRDILGYDLGVAITGSEKIGITLIITEGFGEIAMAEKTFQLLSRREGEDASVNGTTQIRAGVMRPELLIPYKNPSEADSSQQHNEAGLLDIGSPVRIIRDPYFGSIGKVKDLPAALHVLGSESKARVLEVGFDSGESVIVPRANIEMIVE